MDERLDALTMNLELQFREGEAQRARIDALGVHIQTVADNSARELQLLAANTAREFADVRVSIQALMDITSNLVITAQAAIVRIERLERKSA